MKIMDNIDYLHNFQTEFNEHYFDLLANTRIHRLCSLTIDELFGSPHLLFYGNDPTILKMYVDVILTRIFKTTIVKRSTTYDVMANNNKYSCPYKYSDVHLEIDIDQIVSAERQFISDFISNHIAKTKNISYQKHIIVMHNVNSLHEQSMYALRYPIERLSRNVYFIFTAKTTSRIEPSFLSRCFQIRSNIQEENIEQFFEHFLERNKIEDEIEIDPTDGVINNILKLSKCDIPNNIEKQLTLFIDQLLKEKNIFKGCELIRSFGFKILHFNVPIATIMKITLNYLGTLKQFDKYIYDLVKYSTELEYKSISVSKPILIFERYFAEIYKRNMIK
jgi:hypothetical protein